MVKPPPPRTAAPRVRPALESEQLIRAFFAEHATKADLLAPLVVVQEGSRQLLGASARVPQAYLDGSAHFPGRLPWLLLVGQFLTDFHLMVERWAEWSSEIVEAWPDHVSGAEPDRTALEAQAAVTRAPRGEG